MHSAIVGDFQTGTGRTGGPGGRSQRRVVLIAMSTGLYELYRGHCTLRCARVAARVVSRPVSGSRSRALSWVKGSAGNHRIARVFAWSSRCCCERCQETANAVHLRDARRRHHGDAIDRVVETVSPTNIKPIGVWGRWAQPAFGARRCSGRCSRLLWLRARVPATRLGLLSA